MTQHGDDGKDPLWFQEAETLPYWAILSYIIKIFLHKRYKWKKKQYIYVHYSDIH